MPETATLTSRREFLFCYDIKMGNPNGDPDENRPRVLPDKTYYVTDVRLKRFVRDFFKLQGREILVDNIEGKTTDLTGRVAHYLAGRGLKSVSDPAELVNILLDAFIDARLFGSTFAFAGERTKAEETLAGEGDEPPAGPKKKKPKLVNAVAEVGGKETKVAWAPPRTLTGPVQILHGEVKHKAHEVPIDGTSAFGSDAEKARGTFTTYYGLRYALIAFNGIANEHSARVSRLSDEDYALMLDAMWNSVRSAANTRTKRGQVPRLLMNVVYRPGQEFQFGNLTDYVKLTARSGKAETEWSSPDDYTFDISTLLARLRVQGRRMLRLEYCISPDVVLSEQILLDGVEVVNLDYDAPKG